MRRQRRDTYGAVDAFSRDIRHILVCFVDVSGLRNTGHNPEGNPHLLWFQQLEPMQLRGGSDLSLEFTHGYNVEETDDPEEQWRVSTASYAYTIYTKDQKKLLSYHYHTGDSDPESPNFTDIDYPHAHIDTKTDECSAYFAKAHLPTMRMPLERFLQMLVRDFDVKPRPEYEGTYEKTLEDAIKKFESRQTWQGYRKA